MIEKTDLMLGDYVQVLPDVMLQSISHLGYSTITSLGQYTLDTKDFIELKYDEINPIPMSEKILELNGYHVVTIAKRKFWTDDELMFEVIGKLICINTPLGKLVIPYVHRFQHLLNACGLDTNIKVK